MWCMLPAQLLLFLFFRNKVMVLFFFPPIFGWHTELGTVISILHEFFFTSIFGLPFKWRLLQNINRYRGYNFRNRITMMEMQGTWVPSNSMRDRFYRVKLEDIKKVKSLPEVSWHWPMEWRSLFVFLFYSSLSW